jgi:hypothetical protein
MKSKANDGLAAILTGEQAKPLQANEALYADDTPGSVSAKTTSTPELPEDDLEF